MCLAKGNIESICRSFDDLILHHGRCSITLRNSATESDVTWAKEPLRPTLILSSGEASHVQYKTDLAINADMSQLIAGNDGGSYNTESLTDGIESVAVAHRKPNIARTLVMETGSVEPNNTPVDCNQEGGSLNNSYVDNVSSTVHHCINWSVGQNEIFSEEETDTSTNKCSDIISLERSTPRSALNKEPAFKEVRPFVSDDDGTSYNESTFGILPSGIINYNYSDLSYKAKIAGLAGGYCDKDMTQKSHDDHQVTLPCTIDGQVKPHGVVVSGIVI